MPQTCHELLHAHHTRDQPLEAEKLNFVGVGSRDVYNITAPFTMQGQRILAGRVEERSSEQSHAIFFRERGEHWEPIPDGPILQLQDPFFTWVNDELIFGGVETFPHPTLSNAIWWRTKFYRGHRLAELHPFAQGPDGMKDIRLCQMDDGRLAVFTRPQGNPGGRGTIGFLSLPNVEGLTPEALGQAQLLHQFTSEEWGGANEVHRLEQGWLGVLGHIACFDQDGSRHYYPIVFALHPTRRLLTSMELIATRSQFRSGAAKRSDLVDVIFSGGLERNDGGAVLYAGTSDAEAQRMVMPDPFALLSFAQAQHWG